MTLWIGIFGILLAVVWSVRLTQAAFGIRQIPDINQPEWNIAREIWPRVSIVVPARNEQQGIEPALRSLLALDYPDYEVIAINDRSSDDTGAILNRIQQQDQRLRAIHVESLPSGWLGKTHAMHLGAAQARGEWLLFTDADVVFRADTLRRAVAFSEANRADHAVLFPTLINKTWGERMVTGFFQCMFILSWGHSPWKVADPKARDYVGVGAFNLIRRDALRAIGGMEALRMEVIEDLKLGKLVKRHGFRQRIAYGEGLVAIHWAPGALGVVRNLTKNFFALVNYRWPLAFAGVIGLVVVNVAPLVGVLMAPGWARAGYAVALAGIAALYIGMSRYSAVSAIDFFLHPLSCCLVAYSLVRSAILTLWQGAVVWRGTRYPLTELRKGIV